MVLVRAMCSIILLCLYGQSNTSRLGWGAQCVIIFRRRIEMQKIMEMKIPKNEQCTLVQLCTLLTRRKVPAFLTFCSCRYLYFLPGLFVLFLPSPLALSPFLLFLLPSFLLIFFTPFALSSSLYLCWFPASSHTICWKEGTALSTGMRVDSFVAGI